MKVDDTTRMTSGPGCRAARAPWFFVPALALLVFLNAQPLFAAGNAQHGRRIYQQYCTPCHGQKGDGRGPRARNEALQPPPRDHTNGFYMNIQSDVRFFKVIKFGGKANNLSHIMPQWKHILSDRDIFDIIAYIRTLAVDPPYTPPEHKNWKKRPFHVEEHQPLKLENVKK